MTESEAAVTAISQKLDILCMLNHFSRVRLFADPMDLQPTASSVHRETASSGCWLAVPAKQKSVFALSHDSVLNGDLSQEYLIGET